MVGHAQPPQVLERTPARQASELAHALLSIPGMSLFKTISLVAAGALASLVGSVISAVLL
jgi:hypothetical protein